MSWLDLNQVAEAVGGRLVGANVPLASVNTDTRVHEPNALFVALKGARFDAHDVLANASADVAAALLVSRPVAHPAPQVVVDDTLFALGKLAAWWRAQFTGCVIGLTGSNGKTTVKEMLAAICSGEGEVLATRGNYNNHIGMPLTLLQLRGEHDFAVIEMGANHAGEIDYLSRICRPDVALLNNAGDAHLEGFGSLEGVARAKAEIFDGLGASGTAIINRDDDFADDWLERTDSLKRVTFGRHEEADVRLLQSSPLSLRLNDDVLEIPFKLLGEHNAMNAAAAAAAALAAGVGADSIANGLASISAVKGRLCMVEAQSRFLLIDDTYNANPRSMMAAADVLSQQSGRTWLVVGEMAELGEQSADLHQQVARYAAEVGLDRLVSLGAHAEAMATEFGDGGFGFKDIESLISMLRAGIESGDSVLVKGSRSMRMERVVDALATLVDQNPGAAHAV